MSPHRKPDIFREIKQTKSYKADCNCPSTSFGIAFLFLFLLIAFISNPVSAQLSSPGIPYSFSHGLPPVTRDLLLVSAPDTARLHDEDARNPVPYRFAVNIPVNADFNNSGISEMMDDGTRVWRLTLKSPGALALTLYFDRFRLPAGGKLFVYNPIRTRLQGAFTAENNNSLSTFATSLITGDEITLEYNAPSYTELPELRISEVAHAYRGISFPDAPQTGFGASGKCQVNTACIEGIDWQKQKRSVVRLEVKKGSSTLWCTGSLVNNTRNDGTPYVLTADHCGRYATASDVSKWVFYFDYQSPVCENPTSEPAYRSITGALPVAHGGNAGSTGSDFYLVRLIPAIPDSFNVYFNGWNRETTPSPSGVSIHHPEGDIKKISTYTAPAQAAYWPGCTALAHWRVSWAETINGHGTTEPGSSGSPLFDNQGRLVGTLTGGDSACDTNHISLPDYYGMFSYSWDQNGTDSASVLKCWLDPIQSGVTTLNGWALGIAVPENTADISLFPNPVASELNIQVNGAMSRNLTVAVVNILGETLISEQLRIDPANGTKIGVAGLPEGVYLVKIFDGKRQIVKKIVKKD